MVRAAPLAALLALGCSSRPSADVRAFAARADGPRLDLDEQKDP